MSNQKVMSAPCAPHSFCPISYLLCIEYYSLVKIYVIYVCMLLMYHGRLSIFCRCICVLCHLPIAVNMCILFRYRVNVKKFYASITLVLLVIR